VTQNHPKRPIRQAKQERARESVEALLESAARVLVREGYARATTDRIAQTAGVSIGTLYEYFANKDDLFDALIRRELAAVVEAVAGTDLPAKAPLAEKLQRLVLVAMGAMRHGPELIRSLEQVPRAAFRRRLADARTRVVAYVRGLLEAHRDELRITDLDRAAFVIVSAAEGVGSNATSKLFDERLGAEVAALLSLYATGREPLASSVD